MKGNSYHSNHISGIRIEESFGKYGLSCKAGNYCTFGIEQISNQRHYHSSYELCVITSGNGKYFYKDRYYDITKGDLTIADPGVLHEIQSYDPKGLQLIYFFINIIENQSMVHSKSHEDLLLDNFIKHHTPLVHSKPYIIAYLDFIEQYNSVNRNLWYGTYHAVRNVILESLAALSGNNFINFRQVKTQNTLELALDYIDSNLHKKIHVQSIANYSCTSLRNLQYLFQKHLGKTVIGYINERKIALACHYLSMQFSIDNTSYLIGIQNPSQFSKLFKKIKGISPKQYQKINAPNEKGMGRRL